jgi:hypothetical protein
LDYHLVFDKGSLDPINLSGLGEAGNTLQKGFNDPGVNQVLLPHLLNGIVPFSYPYGTLKEFEVYSSTNFLADFVGGSNFGPHDYWYPNLIKGAARGR